MSDGTTGPEQDTVSGAAAPEQPSLELEGFAEALSHMPFPPGMAPEGDPESAEAVDKDESEATPEPEPKDEPDAKAEAEADGEDDGEAEGEAEEAPPVNFDGFTDSQKTILEGLVKEGHVDPEFIEELRKGTLRQSDYTKKTMALADNRRDFEKEMETRKDDLALLDRIRADDHLNEVWIRMSRGDYGSSDPDGDDDELLDAKRAKEMFQRELEQREAKRTAEEKAHAQRVAAKESEVRDMVQTAIRTFGVTPEVMQGYLQAEESAMPSTVKSILDVDVADLQHRLTMRHEVTAAKAEAEKWRAKATKRTSKENRAAKQSLPPAPRVTQQRPSDPLLDTEEALGLDPKWSNVQGFGFRD